MYESALTSVTERVVCCISALDAESERQVQDALDRIIKGQLDQDFHLHTVQFILVFILFQ